MLNGGCRRQRMSIEQWLTAQKKVDRLLLMLQAKAEDFQARSRRNNVCILGIAELTRVDNMERYVEQLLIDLMDRETFSDMFMSERANR
ncbi:hypothetical protein NDU88_007142 [Pleurodeles waltl]|uniref:Uncharacterized protein n=1 Tax=Pleurodeles waltl TaxID=8319 RepID=A0AAV7QK08_PLEWA|nr:hypothetical protein NDU88_007142 [Pleurodeles waltl]